MKVLEGEVFCEVHGCVHPDTPDYYEEGNADCCQENWRTVWIKEADDER